MSFIGDLAGGIPFIGGALKNRIDKVDGIPTAGMSGAQAGGQNKDFLDASYPGTTPWERLGASANYGSVAGPDMQSKTQRYMQEKELRNQKEIAESTNMAHVIGSVANMGPDAMKSAIDAYQGRGFTGSGDYDTQLKQNREKLASEISVLNANQKQLVAQYQADVERARATGAEADIKEIQAKWQNKMSAAGFAESVTRSIGNLVPAVAIAGIAGRYADRMANKFVPGSVAPIGSTSKEIRSARNVEAELSGLSSKTKRFKNYKSSDGSSKSYSWD